MRYALALVAFAMSASMLTPLVLACSCTGPIPFPEALAYADATFTGKVQSVKFKASLGHRGFMRARELWSHFTGRPDPGLLEWYRDPLYGRVVIIQVAERLKGSLAQTVEVHMGPSEDACEAYPFNQGREYLVFAKLRAETTDGKERLEVHGCGMTRPMGEVGDAVRELRAIAASGAR